MIGDTVKINYCNQFFDNKIIKKKNILRKGFILGFDSGTIDFQLCRYFVIHSSDGDYNFVDLSYLESFKNCSLILTEKQILNAK